LWAVTVSILATGAVAQERPANTVIEDSVRALESARGQALLAADTVALSGMIAAEFVEISRFGTLRTRAENLREIAAGDLRLTTVGYDSLTVRMYGGGEVAVLIGLANNAGSYRGQPFSGRIRYTRIFIRRDGRWQAVAMQQTPAPRT
jgi:hypothetical protein